MIENRELVTANDFGALIKERRRALSMSQTALAKKLGASRRWVTDIESGKETAELGRVIKALKILGMHLTAKPVQEIRANTASVSLELKTAKLLAHRDKVGLPSTKTGKEASRLPEYKKSFYDQLYLLEQYKSFQEKLDLSRKLIEQYKSFQTQSKLND